MPVALPRTAREWKGREFPFADADEHEMMTHGQPFYILDAISGFGSERDEIALLCQMVEYDEHGDEHKLHTPFVWTRGESPSRLKLVEFVRSVVYSDNPDIVGPVNVVEIKPKDPTHSSFFAINAYGTGQAAEAVGDNIPF